MRNKIITIISILSVMVTILIAKPAHALDQYPSFDRDANNVINNAYVVGGTGAKLWDIYTYNNVFWNRVAVKNNTASAFTVRTKVIPATADQIKLSLSGGVPTFFFDLDAGVTATCYPAATGGEAWGCQIYMPAGSIAWIYVATYYTGDTTPSWYNTTYTLYNDTYTQTYATHGTWVTLH